MMSFDDEQQKCYRENPNRMFSDADRIQNASNVIAVSGVLRNMLVATHGDVNHPAIIAVFDKLNSLMGLQSYSDREFNIVKSAHQLCSREAHFK